MVQLAHFRGQIEVEEAAFFVRAFDPGTGEVRLSDRSHEILDPDSLHLSPFDGAYLCRVKYALRDGGVLARFFHSAQAEFQHAVEEGASGLTVRIGGSPRKLPLALLD